MYNGSRKYLIRFATKKIILAFFVRIITFCGCFMLVTNKRLNCLTSHCWCLSCIKLDETSVNALFYLGCLFNLQLFLYDGVRFWNFFILTCQSCINIFHKLLIPLSNQNFSGWRIRISISASARKWRIKQTWKIIFAAPVACPFSI